MVIDTEVHIVHRVYLREINPERSLTEPYSWHSHDGDLLVAEMDRAGVDQAFLISYTAQDVARFLERNGMGPEDFVSGKKYVRFYLQKYPDRLYWFTTTPDPRNEKTLSILKKDFEAGAVGVKVFPGILGIHMNDRHLMEVFELARSLEKLVMIGPEETAPPETPTLEVLLAELDEVLSEFPNLRLQLNHAGCFDPLGPHGDIAIRLSKKHKNLFLSTAILGYCFDDEHEYPFPKQLQRIRKLYDGVGIEPLLFATDWPWCEHVRKYVQDVDAIRRHCDFMNDDEKQKFLALNAMRYLGKLAKPRVTKEVSTAVGWSQGSEGAA
ncbi:MAG: amidohydrolase family protein [Blastocatellia bacterium]